jgi:hypothetical protein
MSKFLTVLLVCGLVGCGGGSDGPKPGRVRAFAEGGAFAGNWVFGKDGLVTITCPSAMPMKNPISFTALQLQQDGSDIKLFNSVGCVYQYTAADVSTATAKPGQTCMVPDGRGGKTTESLLRGTLKRVGADTITVDIAGKIGPNLVCDVTVTGTATK